MIKRPYCPLPAIVALAALFCPSIPATACTGIRLTAKDGTVVHARTLEFGMDLSSNVLMLPRHFAMRGTAPSGKPGLAWETKYAAVGMNAQGQNILVDGVNEQGLAGGLFYLPSYAKYQEVLADEESKSLGPWELMTWILTSFSTVDEVRGAIGRVRVGDAKPEGWDYAPPVHFIVHDAGGKSLVIEYIAGQLKLHDDPIGVITNSPDFEWHIKNLSNYVNLSPLNVAPLDLNGLKVAQFGQGSGLLGIPGDFTPPSRFVRATVLSRSAMCGETGQEAVDQAFHILDSFDIPLGDVRSLGSEQTHPEYTQWTTACDTQSRSFYFHTHNNRRVRRFDLLNAGSDAKRIRTIPLGDKQDVENLTAMDKGSR